MKLSLPLLVSIISEAIVAAGSTLSKKDPNPIPLGNPSGGSVSTDGKSTSWAGAWMQAPPSQSYTSVYSEFQVPKPQLPTGADTNTTYLVGEWIGLSNDAGFSSSKDGVIVQAGVQIQGNNGNFSVGAWWEWFPQGEQDLALPIAWGDVVAVNITITSPGTADILVSNKSQNKNVIVPGQKGIGANFTKALYVVEDPLRAPGIAPFIDFGKVIFDDCSATIESKQMEFDTLSGVITMVDGSGKSRAVANISGSSAVNISYVG